MSIDKLDIIKKYISTEKSFLVTGLTSFVRLFLTDNFTKISDKKFLFITSNEQNCLKYQNDLKKAFNLNCEIFPAQEISMYENLDRNFYDYAKQIEILSKKPNLVISPVKALLEKFPNEIFLKQNSINLKIGDEINTLKFAERLVNIGYKRVTMVTDIGEFSIRGDIIDVFSLNKEALRIELWGDEITDLRFFNNQTQKSTEKTLFATILPLISDAKTDISLLKHFSKNEYILIFDESSEIYSKHDFFDKEYQKQAEENELKDYLHVTTDEFRKTNFAFQRIYLNNFIDDNFEKIIEFESSTAPKFNAKIDEIVKFIKSKPDFKLLIASDYPNRIREILNEENIFEYETIENLASNGCISEDFKFLLLTDKELFNKRSKEITSSKRNYYKESADFLENVNDIREGEFIVHSIHGVGIYKGLTQQEIDGQLKDYLTIEYACGDKLHMPAEQVNLLCRYRGAGSAKPKLSRMGGSDWTNTKTKAKKAVEEIAYDLLRLYANRKIASGIEFDKDTAWQVELEDGFEYVETPDQMKAITEVKTDMENSQPMDRLICGDVGFGKTEVAIRAIFKAVNSGKQTAIIVPTTILAMQHFETISERFKPFGVRVELLSRFRNKKEQKETLKHLALGECDVVIATHRLLQKDIIFKDLGLLVIDEEHRFGVKHKEKLKTLKENIDIISMSATPIPRTLYMSLSGIKDISIINTPPKNRLPIKTIVAEFNEEIIKKALLHEIERGGQIFFLHNQIETIELIKQKIQDIVPSARIAIGHGQMDEKMLENIILDFTKKEYDILLCTTIIENGLDIPNANTIIINNADRFGLAQLYQLRGRVGRCEKQAYCYCLYRKNKEITKEARDRLKSIKEFTTLGSGYQIAMRDIEIRGVGNILGTKQHGHMINVGFDTYCQLLEETVQEIQGENIKKEIPTIVDINVTAYIPDEWVGSVEQKMIEYKRLADVNSTNELDYIIEQWKDRFSKAPDAVENLIKLIRLRLSATSAEIISIRETPENIRIYTPYHKAEWDIIQKKLPDIIKKRIKFTIPPQSNKECASILLLNNSYLNFDEIFNILTDLFYYINKVRLEYKG